MVSRVARRNIANERVQLDVAVDFSFLQHVYEQILDRVSSNII
ncbi:MAG TPA: hypothetical protein VKM55_19130 [Candidatus Lokiarchaeia archaeon]|nr:hypothetical protein [Candidatus Lokiarchaeia archaeon]